MPGRVYYVYFMASKHRALYTGVTSQLQRRVFKHKLGVGSVFTSRYRCTKCVYFETFDEVTDAIAREKELKGWRRQRKCALINEKNPKWEDLFAWLDDDVGAVKESQDAEPSVQPASDLDF